MTDRFTKSINNFNITLEELDNIDKYKLKKIYHKLCLKYHPDKNKDNIDIDDNISFLDIKESYEILNEYIENKNTNSSNSHESNLFSFFDSLFTESNIENFFKIIEESINKNKEKIITYNVTLDQLFSKDIFYNKEYNIYIPLWHKCISYNKIISFLKKNTRQDNNENIIFIIKTKTYKNVKILENNDIVINLNKETLIKNSIINIKVCDKKVFEVTVNDKMIHDKYFILLNKGIPRYCETNIYDISLLSHVIILFT